MIDILIGEELKEVCPEMTLGCIQAHVEVESSSNELWQEINSCCDDLKSEIRIEDLASLLRISLKPATTS